MDKRPTSDQVEHRSSLAPRWIKIGKVKDLTAGEHHAGVPFAYAVDVFDVGVFVNHVGGAGEVLDFGTHSGGGDADGFAVGIDATVAGWTRPGATIAGGQYTASTRGALLADYSAPAGALPDRGYYTEKPYRLAAGTQWTYTCPAGGFSADTDIDMYALVAAAPHLSVAAPDWVPVP